MFSFGLCKNILFSHKSYFNLFIIRLLKNWLEPYGCHPHTRPAYKRRVSAQGIGCLGTIFECQTSLRHQPPTRLRLTSTTTIDKFRNIYSKNCNNQRQLVVQLQTIQFYLHFNDVNISHGLEFNIKQKSIMVGWSQ